MSHYNGGFTTKKAQPSSLILFPFHLSSDSETDISLLLIQYFTSSFLFFFYILHSLFPSPSTFLIPSPCLVSPSRVTVSVELKQVGLKGQTRAPLKVFYTISLTAAPLYALLFIGHNCAYKLCNPISQGTKNNQGDPTSNT